MENELLGIEINCLTGEAVYKPLTSEELEQRQIDIAAHAAQVAEQEAAAEAKAAAKASAESKLTALGLTPEEIAALR